LRNNITKNILNYLINVAEYHHYAKKEKEKS